jgi:cell division protein FtsB
MAWLRKKPDPLSDRARALTQEIAQLEDEIKRLGAQAEREQVHPRLRSTALPHGSTLSYPGAGAAPPSAPPAEAAHEPIFEEVDQGRLESSGESILPREHYNELGVRKYDLPALLRRIRGCFQGPSATNPKLVSYLAAGGIQGLRPLRYEKRVARRRFMILAAVLFLVVLGTFLWVYQQKHK